MKILNLLILALLTSIFISCNKDDSSDDEKNPNWTLTLERECRDQSSQFKICVTDEEKERAKDQTVIGEACNWVTVKNINNVSYSGYYRTAATGTNYCTE